MRSGRCSLNLLNLAHKTKETEPFSGPALLVSRCDRYFLTFASFARAAEP